MASILRQIVAGPRARHPEAGLDLCYVTDYIIATSGPSQTYPQLAYRNPLDQLVAFLDSKHGEDWAIWEFRAEGTGYPDEAVYGRIWHYPWPDHHPPPFRLVPMIMASMRNWLYSGGVEGGQPSKDGQTVAATDTPNGPDQKPDARTAKGQRNRKRVVVVHCKAGKGRSGTASCSYLVAEEGWKAEDALARFTERRMRPQFGAGVSIPSQVRWVGYVDRWTKGGKKYLERPIEILEVHVWGLRNGVKVDIEGFADQGKRIEVIHTFKKVERVVVEGDAPEGGGLSEIMWDLAGYSTNPKEKVPCPVEPSQAANDERDDKDKANDEMASRPSEPSMEELLRRKSASLIQKVSPPGSHHKIDKLRAMITAESNSSPPPSPPVSEVRSEPPEENEPGGMAVIFKPTQPIRIPNSDVNISVERRNRTHKSMGLTMVTAVAHVWFNVFFEGQGPEQGGKPNDSGVFSIDWDAMDGIRGSSRRGTRALDRLSVIWRAADGRALKEVLEPKEGEPVPQLKAADWKGVDSVRSPDAEKDLGLRVQNPLSVDVSRASSIKSAVEDTVGQGQNQDEGQGQGQGQGQETKTGLGADESLMEGLRCSGPAGEDLLEGEKRQTG